MNPNRPLDSERPKDLQGDNGIVTVCHSKQENYKSAYLAHCSGHQERLTPGRIASFHADQSADQLATQCDGRCLGAAGDTKFAEDTGDVKPHSGRADHQLFRYLRVALTLSNQG